METKQAMSVDEAVSVLAQSQPDIALGVVVAECDRLRVINKAMLKKLTTQKAVNAELLEVCRCFDTHIAFVDQVSQQRQVKDDENTLVTMTIGEFRKLRTAIPKATS